MRDQQRLIRVDLRNASLEFDCQINGRIGLDRLTQVDAQRCLLITECERNMRVAGRELHFNDVESRFIADHFAGIVFDGRRAVVRRAHVWIQMEEDG